MTIGEPNTLVGENVLGRLLMELREKLKDDEKGVLRTVSPLGIPNFMLLGHPVETVTANKPSVGKRPQSELF